MCNCLKVKFLIDKKSFNLVRNKKRKSEDQFNEKSFNLIEIEKKNLKIIKVLDNILLINL